jgi:hypothetical protein
VQQKRSRPTATRRATHLGDADSVVVTTSGDTTTFVWHGKIDGSVGTHTGVRAAVFAIDSGDGGTAFGDTSNITVSAANVLFNIDGDRPDGPARLPHGTTSWNGYFKVENVSGGKIQSAQDATVNVAVRELLGVGDSLVVATKLGTGIANNVILGDSLSVVLDVHGKNFTFDKARRNIDTLRINVTTTEGQFSDLNSSFPYDASTGAPTDTMGVFVVDKAGNRSGYSVNRLDGPVWGVTSAVNFLFDTTSPVLDSTNGDTILPASSDTITDGSIRAAYANDINPLKYKLGEALDSLFVNFSGASKMAIKVGNKAATRADTDASLKKDTERVLDITQLGSSLTAQYGDKFHVADTDGSNPVEHNGPASGADTLLKTGVHTITFQGKDLAGNLGAVLSRTNVYVDVDDIELVRLFPTKAAFGAVADTRIDTIEEKRRRLSSS